MRQLVIVFVALATFGLAGCVGSLLQSASLDSIADSGIEGEDVDDGDETPRRIADLARPYGMNYVQIEAISLVTGLDGTGADPRQTPQRASLLSEMKRREIANPSRVLASADTALVLVRGYLRPGIPKGDRFDIEVRVPSRSDVKSLRSGWLLSSRLTELAVLGRQIRSGHVLGIGEGAVLVDPAAEDSQNAVLTQGRVLGGGIALKGRTVGLVIDHAHQSVHTSQLIGAMINRRFHTFDKGTERGVANPKTDEFVELKVHPRYADNVNRYMRVIRNIGVRETPSERVGRLELLADQLHDPLMAERAAIRLEAIGGDDAIAALKDAIDDSDAEVRFYASEALAYLDDSAAAEVLADAARNEPSFRLNALAALAAMDDPVARDALESLLDVKSAETRYGAFRALWSMDSHDPLVRGEDLGRRFHLHILPVDGPPMIHATRSFRPEIVLFGKGHRLQTPLVIEAGRHIMIQGDQGDELTISRFAPGEPTQKRVVSTQIAGVVRTIIELGGSYPDVVQALQEANELGALTGRFRVDSLPEPGRKYDRKR